LWSIGTDRQDDGGLNTAIPIGIMSGGKDLVFLPPMLGE
jgi:hypothetical protein